MKPTMQEWMRNPELHFSSPAEILKSIDLNDVEKLKLLSSWKNDLMELQHASEENMDTETDGSSASADVLGQVLAAMQVLEKRLN
jgi:hypothetical protein